MPPKFTIEEPWTKAGFRSQPRAQQNLAIHGVLAHMVRTVRDGLGQSQVQLEDMRRRLERLETLVEVSEAGLGADTEPRHPPSGAPRTAAAGDEGLTINDMGIVAFIM